MLVAFAAFFTQLSWAQNRIDSQRPDAPSLAAYGDYTIGVKTLNVIHPNQINIVELAADGSQSAELPKYDRPLTLEVWYPAVANSQGNNVINAYPRDAKTTIKLIGRAIRDARPLQQKKPYPFVIISHGYPGNRHLLAHLGENLASKGYVVASIDHTDSTYRTLATFSSTLVNRPLDQTFVLNHIEALSNQADSFLYNLVDTQNSAIIGYSMGAYGALIMAGAGLTAESIASPLGDPQQLLAMHRHESATQSKRPDARIKTVVAFAPWGMNHGIWSKTSLANLDVPLLFIAGSVDDVSGYENGVRAIWEHAVNVDRALLTFDNANHNAGAPMPAPKESYYFNSDLGFNVSEHYTDPVWDNVRMNNISQHFVTAWLGKQLKQINEMDEYLSLTPLSNDGIWSKDKNGVALSDHTHWKGFKNRTAKGLRFEWLKRL